MHYRTKFMKSNFFLQLIIVCFSVLFSGAVAANVLNQESVKFWAQEKGTTLLKTFSENDINAKYAKLDEMLTTDVDLDYIAKFVIGKHWRDMNGAQQQQYVNIFKRYALSLYKSFPLSFGSDLRFEIGKVEIADSKATVVTSVFLPPRGQQEQPQEFQVVFLLHSVNNKLQIIDIKLAESSLILS